jgi:hypothetical protein
MLSADVSLRHLESLDFSGKGEDYVREAYVTPLLRLLGYETHKDYEVIRPGDDGSSFKLKYPPVEKGAKKVKHYNPDYIPTVRKKAFWVIEAKSARDVPYPFGVQYLVQGLQYCIHPEIQAKYLVVSTGVFSAVYDAHGSVFLEKDIYEPILEFRSLELTQRWPEVYELLSVERLRKHIEVDLKAMYDKLALSSLDKNYPVELLRKLGASERDHSRAIEKYLYRLMVDGLDRDRAAWRREIDGLDAAAVFARMDDPLHSGGTEGQVFVEKGLAEGRHPQDILHQLINDFDQQSIFRKEQTFVAVCVLYRMTDDAETKESSRAFLEEHKDGRLPLLNQVECAALRLVRKVLVVRLYPPMRAGIVRELQLAPELDRYVLPPTPLSLSYPGELELHRSTIRSLRSLPVPELGELLDRFLRAEAEIEEEYNRATSGLLGSERQLGGGFAYYGVGGEHCSFRNILRNLGIDPGHDAGASLRK